MMKIDRTLSGKSIKPEPFGSYKLAILGGINPRTMYAGTANPWKVAKRHAKNRVAKQSRKVNR